MHNFFLVRSGDRCQAVRETCVTILGVEAQGFALQVFLEKNAHLLGIVIQ